MLLSEVFHVCNTHVAVTQVRVENISSIPTISFCSVFLILKNIYSLYLF